MPEIKLENCWKVVMTEYDDGVQRPMGIKYFDNEQDARNFCREYNDDGTSECFYRAQYYKI